MMELWVRPSNLEYVDKCFITVELRSIEAKGSNNTCSDIS